MRRLKFSGMVIALVAMHFAFGVATTVAQQPASVDDVILLAQSGLDDDTILVFLDYRDIGFGVEAAEIVRLREGGVSEAVVRYLVERSGAPAALAPEVKADSYPPRYYAAFFGSSPIFYGGAGYYPSWWWNDYYYLHFSPRHSYSGGHHLYAGLHGYSPYYGGYGGLYGGHGGHTTYGRSRATSFSGHLGSDRSHLSVGSGRHSSGRALHGGSYGSGLTSNSHLSGGYSGSSHSSRGYSGGRHSGSGYSSGGHFSSRYSGGGHSSGGHFGGGHSSGGHSGGGH